MNNKSLTKPYSIKELVERTFKGIKGRRELDIEEYRCMSVGGRWLEYKVTLFGGHSFHMFISSCRKVLNHCRRMCRGDIRRFVQGVVVSCKQDLADISTKIVNCILSVQTAFGHGNAAVVESEGIETAETVHRREFDALPPFRLGFRTIPTPIQAEACP